MFKFSRVFFVFACVVLLAGLLAGMFVGVTFLDILFMAMLVTVLPVVLVIPVIISYSVLVYLGCSFFE